MQRICPYPGLRTFSETEALYFKGREHHTAKALDLLQKNKFLMLTGASGDGKSSMVFAGIIPQARAGILKGEFPNWKVVDFKPQRDPLLSLAGALQFKLKLPAKVETIEEKLKPGFSALVDIYKSSGLYYSAEELSNPNLSDDEKKKFRRKAHNLLIVVDQFEELFTNPENFDGVSPSTNSKTLINIILETNRLAREQNLPVYIACTMRSDFFGDCSAFINFPELIASSHYFIPRLSREEVRSTIEDPALLSGNKISPRLVERLLYELKGGADMLPVMQHALFRIWKEYNADGSEAMDLIHFAKVGGMPKNELPAEDQKTFEDWIKNQQTFKLKVLENPSLANVLNAHANELYESAYIIYMLYYPKSNFKEEQAKKIIKYAFLGMTRIDEGRAVRNRIAVAELPEIIGDDISSETIGRLMGFFSLQENSLIRTYNEYSNEHDKIGRTVLDITHESLIRNWNHLQEWIAVDQQNVEVLKDFEHLVYNWVKDNKSSTHLLSEGATSFYNEWFKKCKPNEGWIKKHSKIISSRYHGIELLKDIQEFLTASSKNVQIKKKITRVALVTISCLLLVSTYAFYKSEIHGKLAVKQGRISRANELAMQAFLTFEKDPTVALRIAQNSYNTEKTQLAAQSLLNSYMNGPFYSNSLTGHADIVSSASFSPGGEYILSTSHDKSAIIWKRNGVKHKVLKGHHNIVNYGFFSEDEKHLLTVGEDSCVIIWSVDGSVIGKIKHLETINYANFIHNGKYILTCSDDGTIGLWTIAGQPVFKTNKSNFPVTYCNYSSATGHIISVSNNIVSIWDITGKLLKTIKTPRIQFNSAKWIGNNEFITYGNGNIVGLWKNDQLVKTIAIDCEDVLYMKISSDKAFSVIRTENNRGYILALKDFSLIPLIGHEARIEQVNISNGNDLVVTASDDQTVRIWNLNGDVVQILKTNDLNYSAEFSKDDSHLVTSHNAFTIKVWEISKKSYFNLFAHKDYIWNLETSPKGKYFGTASWDNSVKIWDYVSGSCIKPLSFKSKIEHITFSQNEDYAAITGNEGIAYLYNLKEDKLLPLQGHQGKIYKPHFNPVARQLVTSGKDGTIKVWDFSGKLLKTLNNHQAAVKSLSFDLNGNMVSGSLDNTCKIWDKEYNCVTTLSGFHEEVYAVAISADGKHIATGCNDHTIKIWGKKGNLIRSYRSNSSIQSISFSPKNNILIYATSNGNVGIWNFLQRGSPNEVKSHSQMVNVSKFSPDEKHILTCSDDGTAKLFDLTGKELNVYQGHKGGVQTCDFSKDGNFVFTAGADGTVKKWPLLMSDVLNWISEKDQKGEIYKLSDSDLKKYNLENESSYLNNN